MKRLKIALEGPINKCSDAECVDWRKKVIEELGLAFDFHNPMDFDCRGKEEELEKELITYDEKGIASSDIILVMAEKPGWGTAMAVQMAYGMHKDILTICPSDKPSPWLKNRSSLLFKNLDDAIAFIKYYGK